MKKYTLIVLLTLISTIEIMANFPPSKEQIENAKKIEELRKTNEKGKNKAKILMLLNANKKEASKK